jgi:hypothetical protein
MRESYDCTYGKNENVTLITHHGDEMSNNPRIDNMYLAQFDLICTRCSTL